MQTHASQIVGYTILITTLLLILFSSLIIRYFFFIQRKRYTHQQELLELREAFTQTLLQSKLEIQEQTLDHIAKELHANFSHLVSLININLSVILPLSDMEARESILETKSLAKQLLSELKALSASLNTDHIMKIGFINALDNELARLRNTKKFQVTFTKTGPEFRLQPEQEIILFRLCQEILNNILNYSRASSVIVSLIFSDADLTLEISDNGIGFDLDEQAQKSDGKTSTGLDNIKKRAKLIGAEVMLESSLGNGTHFFIYIPRKATV